MSARMASLPIPEVEEIEAIYGLEGNYKTTRYCFGKAVQEIVTNLDVFQVLSRQRLAISGWQLRSRRNTARHQRYMPGLQVGIERSHGCRQTQLQLHLY